VRNFTSRKNITNTCGANFAITSRLMKNVSLGGPPEWPARRGQTAWRSGIVLRTRGSSRSAGVEDVPASPS